jgi:hypothetical protein
MRLWRSANELTRKMATNQKYENTPERLARGVPKAKGNARVKPGGKSAARPRAGRDFGRTMADARRLSPIVRLIQSLGEEKIRFQLVGMSAAILQGVIVTTLDVDMWVDLPERQYVRLLNLVVKQGGTALAPTLYALADGRLVNFLFTVHGVRDFDAEYKNALDAKIESETVKVLPLERILKSKKTVLRDKDRAHILLIERFLKGRKKLKGSK